MPTSLQRVQACNPCGRGRVHSAWAREHDDAVVESTACGERWPLVVATGTRDQTAARLHGISVFDGMESRDYRGSRASHGTDCCRPDQVSQCLHGHAARMAHEHPGNVAAVHQLVHLAAADSKGFGRLGWSVQQSLYWWATILRLAVPIS